MSVKAALDQMIDDYQDMGYTRIEITLGAVSLADLKDELAPLLTHRTQSWHAQAYRGCPIRTVDDPHHVAVVARQEAPV